MKRSYLSARFLEDRPRNIEEYSEVKEARMEADGMISVVKVAK